MEVQRCGSRRFGRPGGRGKWMVSLVNSHTHTTSIGWHLWEIDLRFAPGLAPGRGATFPHASSSALEQSSLLSWKKRECTFALFPTSLRFRGGLVFKAHRLVYHSTPGLRVIKKKKKKSAGRCARAGTECRNSKFELDALCRTTSPPANTCWPTPAVGNLLITRPA